MQKKAATNDRINILFVNPNTARTGGSNISLLGIIEGLDRSRFVSHMAIPLENEYQGILDTLEVQLIDFKTNLGWFPTVNHLNRHLAGLHDRVFRLVAAIRERNISLVYTNADNVFEGGLAAKILGIPHIWAQRTNFNGIIEVFDHFPMSKRSTAELISEISDRIVCDSQTVVDSFAGLIPAEKLLLIESGLTIPKTWPSPDSAKSALARMANIPPEGRIVLTLGRISPEKDLLTFVKTACAILRNPSYTDVHFIHIGDTSDLEYSNQINQYCMTQGVAEHILFLGSIDPTHVNEMYRAADVFLLTSKTEGFARTCAEAMLAELPTVSTRCGGPCDYIEDGKTGFLCDIEDSDALADRIAWILDNPVAARIMGETARLVVATRYDERGLNLKWITLFEELNSQPRINTAAQALKLELIVNLLTHLGRNGVINQELNFRLNKAEKLSQLVLDNPLARTIKRVFRGEAKTPSKSPISRSERLQQIDRKLDIHSSKAPD
ncbi:MAG: glycosyltransferase family 4 protein [Sulfuriferula sp.]